MSESEGKIQRENTVLFESENTARWDKKEEGEQEMPLIELHAAC